MKTVNALLLYALAISSAIAVTVAMAFAAEPPSLVWKQGNDTLTLLSGPCNAKVANLLKPEFVGRFKDAVEVFNGKTSLACWVPINENIIYIQYDNDQETVLPYSLFVQPVTAPVKPKNKYRRNDV